MIIERTTNHSLHPEAYDTLFENTTAPTYHASYSKRPPLGIYNYSLQKIWKGFENVLDALDQLDRSQPFRDQEQFGSNFDNPLMDAQEDLLMAIKEHFDDCLTVLKCFYPYSIGSKKEKFNKEKVIVDYKTDVVDFFTHISQIANHIKHHQGRPVLLVMFNEKSFIPGYFLQGVNEKGIILPYREIHLPVRSEFDPEAGYDTAFSFFYDLRYLFYGVYALSHHLAKAINQIAKPSVQLPSSPIDPLDNKALLIAKRIYMLPTRFYEDELKKETPSIKVIETQDETIIRLACPGEHVLIASFGPQQNVVPFLGDGVSTQYKFPYWRGKLSN